MFLDVNLRAESSVQPVSVKRPFNLFIPARKWSDGIILRLISKGNPLPGSIQVNLQPPGVLKSTRTTARNGYLHSAV